MICLVLVLPFIIRILCPHNKHISVRPKKVCLFWEIRFFGNCLFVYNFRNFFFWLKKCLYYNFVVFEMNKENFLMVYIRQLFALKWSKNYWIWLKISATAEFSAAKPTVSYFFDHVRLFFSLNKHFETNLKFFFVIKNKIRF